MKGIKRKNHNPVDCGCHTDNNDRKRTTQCEVSDTIRLIINSLYDPMRKIMKYGGVNIITGYESNYMMYSISTRNINYSQLLEYTIH